MRYFAVVAAAGLALVLAASAARAGAWCAWFDPYTYNCGFASFQQCLDTVMGEGGFCARNVQDATPAPAPAPKPVRKRHRHD